MSTPLFPFPRFFFRERPASRGEKGGYMRIKPKNPKVLRARRIIVGGVALAAVLFVLLRPNTDSSLSTEESAPMPETAATPVPEAEDAQGELNWQYPPGWVESSGQGNARRRGAARPFQLAVSARERPFAEELPA